MHKYKRQALLLMIATLLMGGIGYLYTSGPQKSEPVWLDFEVRQPTVPIIVLSVDYTKSTKYAIDLWNLYADCNLFEEYDPIKHSYYDVIVKSVYGMPCNGSIDNVLHTSTGHAGETWQCPGYDGWDILIMQPGDLRDQLYIVAHELGHVLGLADDDRHNGGLMNQFILADKKFGDFIKIRPSDKDVAALKSRYCK